jgi:DNA-binding NarL/FixJ family response regulator
MEREVLPKEDGDNGENDSSGRGQSVPARFERKSFGAGWLPGGHRDGEEALRLACEQPPHPVLLDMLLPRLSGPAVFRSLRTTPRTARIPIAVLSSLAQSNERKLRKDGAAAYIEKSTLGLHQNSEFLIETGKRVLDEQMQQNGDAELPVSISLP